MTCNVKMITQDEIEYIKPLWEKLNDMHHENSSYFKDRYAQLTFEDRKDRWRNFSQECIRIELLYDDERPIGYCVASIENDTGEIESIFIEEVYRKRGFGKKLIEQAIEWLQACSCSRIVVAVVEGREDVFEFYKKYNFYPSLTYLQFRDV